MISPASACLRSALLIASSSVPVTTRALSEVKPILTAIDLAVNDESPVTIIILILAL